jgi:flavin-dependent dehydrogenase
MTTSDFDVIVVGGGPAGSKAAYYLGQKGIKMLVIDKKKFSRDKFCGGGISYRILAK